MPIFQFKCSCGNEFEKIVPAHQELYKWCYHCDHLTTWETIRDPHSTLYKELVCTDCLGNEHVAPLLSPTGPRDEESVTATCEVCGGQAVHILCIEPRGKDDVSHSSVRFHFNYLSPDV
jgi:hypothetical protein